MKKISIAMYSTFKRPGWKSEQLESLVPELRKNKCFEKGYGIKRLEHLKDKDLVLSPIPLIISRFISKLSKMPLLHTFIKDYYAYLCGEYLTGVLFANMISKDSSEIVYLKPRPVSIIQKCKARGKFIILEFGELHPYTTQRVLEDEYEKYSVKEKYIFTSRYAIKNAVRSIDMADMIIVLSEESKKSFISNGIKEDKIKVVNLGLTEKYNNEFDHTKEFAFVCTAKHSFVKGTHNLLLAWREAKICNMKLYIVGNLSADIEQFINDNGPFENVVFLGQKNIHDLYKNYNFIGVLNSFSEGYGRSVIEYMGYGFPVITTPVATCDIVVHEKNGLIVNSSQELIAALTQFANKDIDYLKMGAAARFSAESTLNKSYTTEMIHIFKGL